MLPLQEGRGVRPSPTTVFNGPLPRWPNVHASTVAGDVNGA